MTKTNKGRDFFHLSGLTDPVCSTKMRSPSESALAARRWLKNLSSKVSRGGTSTHTTDGRHPPKTEEEPREEILSFRQRLEAEKFFECSQLLIEVEEQMFWERQVDPAFKFREEDVAHLEEDYRELEAALRRVLQLSLSPEELRTQALSSAVQAILLDAEQDQRWRHRTEPPPPWRPSGWRIVHDHTLRSLVERRMDNPSVDPSSPVELSSLQQDITGMARQLKVDLLLVVGTLKDCYPPQMDICNFYGRLYHHTFSSRMKKVSEFGLDDKDCTSVLQWVNDYYPGILQKPELAPHISMDELGRLLPEEALAPLEEQYLSKQQDDLTSYIRRILEEAKEKWSKGEEPTREDGCFVSPVAYDIIQCIDGMVRITEKVVGDRGKAQSITALVKDLMSSFKSFQAEIIRQNKPNSSSFVKAKLSCVEQFSEVLQNHSSLFTQDVRKECLRVLADMKQSAHEYLLKPVHEALKPYYRKIGTTEWLNKPVFEKLLVSLQAALQVLQGCTATSHQKLISQMHEEVTAEYVRRLLKGELKLKDKTLQLKACQTVVEDGENLHRLFTAMGSKEDWLKEILTKIAEVLKLQDLPAIQMQVASLATAFPDLSERHVSALLKLKTNLSRSDRRKVKDTLMVTLSGSAGDLGRPFFSSVLVK